MDLAESTNTYNIAKEFEITKKKGDHVKRTERLRYTETIGIT